MDAGITLAMPVPFTMLRVMNPLVLEADEPRTAQPTPVIVEVPISANTMSVESTPVMAQSMAMVVVAATEKLDAMSEHVPFWRLLILSAVLPPIQMPPPNCFGRASYVAG